ncbi:MAG: response regulator [Spirochaetes bacterium]|nr:response regulator [Spirochaetota bacterium]
MESAINSTLVILSLIITLFPTTAESASPVILTDEHGSFPIENRLDIIANEDKTLTIEAVSSGRAKDLFTPARDTKPRFKYSHTLVWIRFDIHNGTRGDSEFILELDCPPIDSATLFIQSSHRKFETITVGDLHPFRDRPLGNRKPLFPLKLDPGSSRTYYMKLESLGTIQAFLTVWKSKTFFTVDHQEQILFGIFFGILLALGLYNLFIYLSVRDKAYLAYITYIFGFAIWASWNLGFINEYLPDSLSSLANISGPFSLFLSFAGVLLFISLFLHTSITMPFMEVPLKIQTVICLLGMPLCFLLNYDIIIRAITIMGYTVPLTALICGFLALAKRKKEARFFLAAWIILIAGSIIFILKDRGYLPYNFATKYAIFIGSGLEVLLFSFALGDRINIMRVEKEEAQGEALTLQKELTDSLELKVEARTRELKEAYAKLQSLDRTKSNVFASISHEFRTPLTLILSPVESALSGDMSSDLDSTMLESIRRNAVKLLCLINDLLDLSKLDAGGMKLLVGKIDIASMVRAHADAIDAACRTKNIAVQVNTPAAPVYTWCDRKMMGQVIDNLLSNAIKFTDPGGTITIDLSENTQDSWITVEDTGMGIPPGDLDIIFDRFTQTNLTQDRRYEGTGIGLAIANEFTDLHGGAISVNSRHINTHPDDHGTSFIVTLPRGRKHFEGRNDVTFHEDDGAAPAITSNIGFAHDSTGTDDAPARAGKEKEHAILVVEDNPDMYALLARILCSAYDVHWSRNGAEALQLLDTIDEPPDLVLADIMMPVMSGIEFTSRLRSDERFAEIPVIMLTALADTEMKLEGFSCGATDYVTKPFNIRELKSRVALQLRMKSLRDRLERTNRELYERLKEKARGARKISATTEDKVKHVTEFIEDNYQADLTRDGLAAAVGMSSDHLSRAFNGMYGKKIPEYISEVRVREAARRLEQSNDSVLHIAYAVGFENLRTFNRAFLKIMKMTPRDFRSGRN